MLPVLTNIQSRWPRTARAHECLVSFGRRGDIVVALRLLEGSRRIWSGPEGAQGGAGGREAATRELFQSERQMGSQRTELPSGDVIVSNTRR